MYNQEEEMDYVAGDYEFADVDDMYFGGQLMGDSDSEGDDGDGDEYGHLVCFISRARFWAYAINAMQFCHWQYDLTEMWN